MVILKIFDIENIWNNPEWISECIRGSFKSPNEYPNIFIVVLECEYFRIWIYSMGIIRISECIRIFVTLWFTPVVCFWSLRPVVCVWSLRPESFVSGCSDQSRLCRSLRPESFMSWPESKESKYCILNYQTIRLD